VVRIFLRERESRNGCLVEDLKLLKIYESMPIPTWGGDLSGIKFDDIHTM